MPGPRLPSSEVRLALSNEPLNTIVSSGCFLPILINVSAAARETFSFSSEQGPASRRSFLGLKSIKEKMWDSGNQEEQRCLVSKIPEFHIPNHFFWCLIAAAMKAAKSGCA